MASWWARARARLTGAVSPDLAQAVLQWSQVAARLNELIGSGSVISAADRSVILVALQALRDLPTSGASADTELLEAAGSLESRLMADELAP